MQTTTPKGKLILQMLAMPGDTNANGNIFGGWLVAQLDIAAGIAAQRRAKSRVTTVAIESMRFIKPINVGDTVCCYVDLITVGRTSMKFYLEAWTLSLNHEEPIKVANGIFIFVAVDDHGRPLPVDR